MLFWLSVIASGTGEERSSGSGPAINSVIVAIDVIKGKVKIHRSRVTQKIG